MEEGRKDQKRKRDEEVQLYSPSLSNLELLYFIIHKPREVLSDRIDSKTTLKVIDPKHPRFGERITGVVPRTTVYDVAGRAGFPTNLGLAGRLDYMTSGIMLMSNDSKLLEGVIRPSSCNQWTEDDSAVMDETKNKELLKYKTKVYEVHCFSERLYREITNLDAIAEELAAPFTFSRQGKICHTLPARVKVLRRWHSIEHSQGRPELGWSVDLSIELREGKHHQIRRMCKRSKFIISTLHRVKIASILSIESIPNPGDCRWLTTGEVEELYEGLGLRDMGKKTPHCGTDTPSAEDDVIFSNIARTITNVEKNSNVVVDVTKENFVV